MHGGRVTLTLLTVTAALALLPPGTSRRHLQQAACTGSVVFVTDAPLSVRQAADRFGTVPRVLLAANPQLTADTTIAPGSTLCIPPLGGITLIDVAPQKAAINAELQAALSDAAAFELLFSNWVTAFGKTYPSPAERAGRAAIFRSNLPRMVQLNSNPAYTFWMQPAFYTDFTDEEFIRTHYGADNYPRRAAGFPSAPAPPAPPTPPTPPPAAAPAPAPVAPVVVALAAVPTVTVVPAPAPVVVPIPAVVPPIVIPPPVIPPLVIPSPVIPSPVISSPIIPSPMIPSPVIPSPAIPSPVSPKPQPSPQVPKPQPSPQVPKPQTSQQEFKPQPSPPEVKPEVSPKQPEYQPPPQPPAGCGGQQGQYSQGCGNNQPSNNNYMNNNNNNIFNQGSQGGQSGGAQSQLSQLLANTNAMPNNNAMLNNNAASFLNPSGAQNDQGAGANFGASMPGLGQNGGNTQGGNPAWGAMGSGSGPSQPNPGATVSSGMPQGGDWPGAASLNPGGGSGGGGGGGLGSNLAGNLGGLGRRLAQVATIDSAGGGAAGPAPEGACTDVAPDSRYTCEQQKGWGKCSSGWMIAGKYCARTCGRCGAPGASPAPAPTPTSTAVPASPPVASPAPPGPPAPAGAPSSPLPPAFSSPPPPLPPPVPVPAGVPDLFNWVEQGKVTPVKDQGNCSSCWAFAAAAALESLNAIQRGPLLNVSVQDIIDCSPVTPGYPPRAACGPGMSTEAMELTSTSGVTTPSVYGDYTASYGSCNVGAVTGAPPGQLLRNTPSPGYVDVTPRSAVEMMRAVSQRPITILMWAPALLRDVKGIYNGPCPDTLPANNDVKATYFNTYGLGENHEVAVVGYDASGGIGAPSSYITFKNSWGEGVGNSGYFNIRMEPDGSNGWCAIYLFPLLPQPLTT
ncbi:hypothetical protein N2152v2_003700 [Parachlorella kessleri]